ncbi:hypothetical protein PQX77_020576 [Marasmius sp. AFHP31]|nr:hypothetical protein PQX77_020576 [Marasmius sp. AFHP31]
MQYAREHGYPELIPGDPHDTTRFKELDSSTPDSKPETPLSRLTSPSTYSLVEAPLEPKLKFEDAPTAPTPKEIMVTPTRWVRVRGFLNRYYKSLDRSVNTPKVADTEEVSDEWALVYREDTV